MIIRRFSCLYIKKNYNKYLLPNVYVKNKIILNKLELIDGIQKSVIL